MQINNQRARARVANEHPLLAKQRPPPDSYLPFRAVIPFVPVVGRFVGRRVRLVDVIPLDLCLFLMGGVLNIL